MFLFQTILYSRYITFQSMRCWQGKPEVNAGRYFGRVDVDAMGCISDPKVTHSLLTVLILILVAVMFVLLYFNRRKVQENVKPLIDNFQRSMQYKTIEKVRKKYCDEVSIEYVNCLIKFIS